MDQTIIKTLLESQERAYKSAMEVVVKQLTEQVRKLETTVSDLTTSLEFTQREVDDLKSTVRNYEKEKQEAKTMMEKLVDEVESSNSKVQDLEDRVNYQDDYSRRNNLRISGMEEPSGGETWEQTATSVTTLLENKLQLPGLVLERAHRVGQRRDAAPRTIVARFARYSDREAVMRNARKLKGTNIFINDDLCAASQAIKSAQMPKMKQAKAQGKIAYFIRTKLIIKERDNREHDAGRGRQLARERDAARAPGDSAAPVEAESGNAPDAAADAADAAPGGGEGTSLSLAGGDDSVPPLREPRSPGSRLQTAPVEPKRKDMKYLRSSAKK